LFVAEGIRTIEELLRSPIVLKGVLAGPRARETTRGAELLHALTERLVEVIHLDEAEFASAAETDSPQGVLAIAEVPQRRFDSIAMGPSCRLLILDAIQDPGNVGTILRTAAAMGTEATIALPGTVDLWNAKVVRSAMGAHFHHLAFPSTLDELDAFLSRHGVALWAADAKGEPVESAEPPARLALVVGNEGGGLEPVTRARAERMVALPLEPTIDSLNVAVAAGILLYVLRRK
jgi:RNA methyltransferase, TrmH family